MSAHDLPILKALGAKMDYLAQRQALIAQNIANADTPGYRPRDLAPADFGAMVRGADTVRVTRTHAGHMAPGMPGATGGEVVDAPPWEVAPAGNAVVMEQQLVAASETMMDYTLATSLYQKQVGLLKAAVRSQ
jgi:flagellar basal-body rod protein FlgB